MDENIKLPSFTRCSCGHTLSDHSIIIGNKFNCNKCNCLDYKESALLQRDGKTINDTEERLRAVLRSKYQEFCPNCERHLGISDVSWEEMGSKYRISNRIVCQNCFKTIVDIVSSKYDSFDNINGFIKILDEIPEKNEAE